MPTTLSCPKCQVRLQTPDSLLGKAIHCPRCKKPIRLKARGITATPSVPFPDPDARLSAPAPGESKPASEEDSFVAGLDQVDDFDNLELPNVPTAPKQAAAPADNLEELMEEAVEEEALEEEASAQEKETVEERVVEEPAEEVAEETLEEEAVEEEEEEEGKLSKAVEKFLTANLFLIKGASGLFSMNAAWDFLNPDTKKKVGSAVERPEGILQVLRFFLRRNWLPSKIEVREEKTNELVFVVKRPAYFFNCTLEVRDPNNKLLAKFTYKPLSRLVGKPMPLERKGGEKFATCEFYFLKGRVDLMDDKKKELANMQTESAFTKAIKIYWAPRGGSYYVTINKPLFDKPLDKMIFLGVTLAMDLMQEDAKASSGKGGISIGT